MFKRFAPLAGVDRTFFLWGPRQTGKSLLLRTALPDAHRIDLLGANEFAKYQVRPESLREEVTAPGFDRRRWIVLDEVQKVPALLDEVHALIEDHGLRFALCGSSARKVRRGHANLLGGRALRFELRGLTATELGSDFDLVKLLNTGYLPAVYTASDPRALLRAYCADYLKEEIAAEGWTRNLPAFARFLEVAALADGELTNFATIARDVGVSAPTVKGYFEILTDTLLGNWLPAYRARPKRRIVESPKFYWFDVGVVNVLAHRRDLEPGGAMFGKAFENWVHQELAAHRAYRDPELELSFWRLSTGVEVDFVCGPMACAIEAKAAERVTADHLRGLRELRRDHPELGRAVVVSLERVPRRTEDGIDILPVDRFVEELAAGALYAAR
jgi:uncharacterized protein